MWQPFYFLLGCHNFARNCKCNRLGRNRINNHGHDKLQETHEGKKSFEIVYKFSCLAPGCNKCSQ